MFKTAQDLDTFIANAVQRGQAGLAATPGQSSFLSPLLGLNQDPIAAGFGKGYGGIAGGAAGINEFGSLKWNAMSKHLPAIAGVAGGAMLTKALYDRWQTKKVREQILANPDLIAKYQKKDIEKALGYIGEYAPGAAAKNPAATEDLTRKILMYDGVGVEDIKKLLEIEKAYQESRGVRSQFFNPIGAALSAIA